LARKKSRGANRSGSRRRAKARRAQRGRGSLSLTGRLSSLVPSLSAERKGDLIGITLFALGAITVWGALAPKPGLALVEWDQFLRTAFGWGAYAIPFTLCVTGGWLLLRDHREGVPPFDSERLLGTILLFIGLLVLLQAIGGILYSRADITSVDAGQGGGVVGEALLVLCLRGLGVGGTLVVLITWSMVGLTFALGVPLPQLLESVWGPVGAGVARVRAWVPSLRRQLVSHRGAAKNGSNPAPGTDAFGGETAQANKPKGASIEGPPAALAEGPEFAPRQFKTTVWALPDREQILVEGTTGRVDHEYDRQRAKLIEETLKAFGAPCRVVEINRGPVITQFGVEPEFVESRSGRRIKVKVSKIASLADDLALALAAASVRVEAPVPGKGYVGVEVPNNDISLVALRDVISGPEFERIDSSLRMGLGQDVSGRPVVADLVEMPHLLVAGTTGSGKSVCINAIIACLLLQNTPDELQFLMVDPKRVELTNFNGIPHLLAPVVVELERVVPGLQWLSREMDERYRRFSERGVRHIDEYNRRMKQDGGKPLPKLVVVIDELADLMMLAPDETERVITRLAQLARATGIHLVIATQRPSVDVVTGLIKANFPARIAFAVASSVDSRVILDQPGAERLLGRGDMLFQAPDAAAPIRLQGSFVSDAEMRRLIRYWKRLSLNGEQTQPSESAIASSGRPANVAFKQTPLWEDYDTPEGELDELFDEAVELVRDMKRGSVSLLQRRLRIGYTRAARLIDQMEERGIVGPQKSGSLPREVLDYGEDVLQAEEGQGSAAAQS
jgi:S-DNA-T family DNA segregation ATPase FtsK/SpoIIIE